MTKKNSLRCLVLLAAALPTLAMAATPEGVWKTIDDHSGKVKSLVTISEQNGILSGKVSRIMDPAKREALCTKCKGSRKNQKIEGMNILWDMTKEGDIYDDGKIIDPESGKVYSASMKLLDNGNKMEVRGYIGFSLIGRSQVWERARN